MRIFLSIFLFVLISLPSFGQEYLQKDFRNTARLSVPNGEFDQDNDEGIMMMYDEHLFMIIHTPIPEEDLSAALSGDLKELYQGVTDSYLETASKDPAPKVKKVKNNGVEGRQIYYFQMIEEGVFSQMVIQLYLYKDGLYGFGVGALDGKPSNKHVKKFMKSLKLH